MLPELSRIKGIHPGAILRREIDSRGIRKKELAQQIDEFPQTISAILNERRGINPALSIKLGAYFNVDITYFMLLQSYFDVFNVQQSQAKINKPDISKFREILFWDTDIQGLDWEKQEKAIIQRVFERGNDDEFAELIAFYGIKKVKEIIDGFIVRYPNYKNSKSYKLMQ